VKRQKEYHESTKIRKHEKERAYQPAPLPPGSGSLETQRVQRIELDRIYRIPLIFTEIFSRHRFYSADYADSTD
jgi:hypothetical protein